MQTLLPLNQCTGVNLPSYVRNDAMQRRLTQLMAFDHITDEDFFVTNVAYATYALSDLVRAPDKLNVLNPFTNVGVDYGDATLNADIARIDAEPFAALYFHWASDFRGKIGAAKVISIQTDHDQLVIPANQYVLRQTLPATQLTSALVDEATPTHCGFTLAEGVAGWEALRTWIASDAQPSVNDLQHDCTNAVAAGAAGPCRYDASIAVPTFDSQVRPRQQVAALALDGTYSGQWFDPARNGEGIALEMLGDGHALVYMFTYPPSGYSGQQAWLIGIGDVVGNGIEFADVLRSSLAADGSLQAAHWGRMGLVFSDCNNASMRWDGPSDWGSMEVPLSRVTAFAGLGCPASGNPPAQASGAWSDPRYNGSGFVFEQLDAQHLATIYFGFDSAGNQIWLSGIAQQGAGGYGGPFYQPSGPRFGSNYNPSAFNPVLQGELSGLHLQCTSGNVQVQGFPGLPDTATPWALALSRITIPLGVPQCGP